VTKLRKLKSLAIIILIALALYQTGRLWFVNITNRSFFIYVTAFFNSAVPDGDEKFTRPMRVIFGNGDGRFDMRYGENLPEADNAIREILRRGVFSGSADVASAFFVASHGPMVIYEYAFPMQADIFALAFSQSSAARLTDRGVYSFNSVAVLPSSVVFFGDERAWTFSLQSGDFVLPEFYINNDLYFTASFRGDFFPQTQTGWLHRPIAMSNPYANRSGELRLDSVNAQVSHFFDNPAMRNPRMLDNVITISTINTVVRYLPGNVLEFNCFRSVRRGTPTGFKGDFSAALDFINRDVNVINDFYLAGYEARGRTHVFWFNYVIDGFPLLALEHPIEVEVDRGRVSRYRKTAFTYHLNENQQYVLTQGMLIPSGEGTRPVLGYPAVSGAALEVRWTQTRGGDA
jgi:hypothetical protein